MEKQRSCFRGRKRFVGQLSTISEVLEVGPLQNRLKNLEENREEILQLKKSYDKCSHKRDVESRCQETLKGGTVLFRQIDGTFTVDRCPMFEHQQKTPEVFFQTEKQKDINEAKALFPDFFPRAVLQETCELDSSWKARPTMEQIFSGQNNVDFSVKCGLHDTNFEYWKRYQLSF